MSKKKNSEPKERYRAEWLGQPLTAEEARAKGRAGGIIYLAHMVQVFDEADIQSVCHFHIIFLYGTERL